MQEKRIFPDLLAEENISMEHFWPFFCLSFSIRKRGLS